MYTRRETETSAQCKLRGDTRIEIEQTGRIDDAIERRTGMEEKHETDGKKKRWGAVWKGSHQTHRIIANPTV